MHPDQQFLEYIARAIVNKPEEVKSTRTVDERGVLITLDVNPTDIGYVIGRRGMTVRAIRTLLRVVGAKNNASVNLKINEPEGGRKIVGSPMSSASTSAPTSAPASSSAITEDVDTSAIDDIDI